MNSRRVSFFIFLIVLNLLSYFVSQVSETAIYLHTGSEMANGRRVRFLFVLNCFKLIILFVSQVLELANGRRVSGFWFLIVLSKVSYLHNRFWRW